MLYFEKELINQKPKLLSDKEYFCELRDYIKELEKEMKSCNNKKLKHEIRNQMAVLEGFVGLYEDFHKIIDGVREKVDRSLQNIKNLKFRFSNKLEQDNTEKKSYLFNNLEINKELIDIYVKLGYDANKGKKKIDAEVKSCLSSNEKIFTGLSNHDFHQVVLNLARNSGEAFDKYESYFIYKIKKIRQNDKQEYLLIRLEDNGCGIDDENINKIFEEDFSTKQRVTNLERGQGLPGVKELVEKAGGNIKVYSKKDIGTCFTILIPIQKIEYINTIR
mgnify:CR=1 FL=1